MPPEIDVDVDVLDDPNLLLSELLDPSMLTFLPGRTSGSSSCGRFVADVPLLSFVADTAFALVVRLVAAAVAAEEGAADDDVVEVTDEGVDEDFFPSTPLGVSVSFLMREATDCINSFTSSSPLSANRFRTVSKLTPSAILFVKLMLVMNRRTALASFPE